MSGTPLERLMVTYPSVLVGYSGGVDSALLAVVAHRVLGSDRSIAVIGISPSLAEQQQEQAREVARRFDLRLITAETHELEDPEYAANPTNRCYFCKRTLWQRLRNLGQEWGMAIVADGTNLDDLRDHRPGHAAAVEAGIRSPLIEAEYTKEMVRAEAHALGIPVWDAPASPCLSSRVIYGLSITPDRLRQVERGEALLRGLGVRGDLRVRHRGLEARIEVGPSEFDVIRSHQQAIADGLLGLGFEQVTLDLNGYRRGNLLRQDEPTLELLAERA